GIGVSTGGSIAGGNASGLFTPAACSTCCDTDTPVASAGCSESSCDFSGTAASPFAVSVEAATVTPGAISDPSVFVAEVDVFKVTASGAGSGGLTNSTRRG